MAANSRIKGQELVLSIVNAGVLEDQLTAIVEFNDEHMFELKEQGYLGEPTDRIDEVYKGAKFDLKMHLATTDFFRFRRAAINRAKRITPNVVFNMAVTFFFPNGQTATITYPDVKWGPMPMNAPSRSEFVSVKLEGRVGDSDENLE